MANARPQCLLAKIDRGIDQDLLVVVLNKNGNAQPLVSRVLGKAGLTVTPDRRNAGRGACAEECKLHKWNAGILPASLRSSVVCTVGAGLLLAEYIRA